MNTYTQCVEAAGLFRSDYEQFKKVVHRTLKGGSMQGVRFEKLI